MRKYLPAIVWALVAAALCIALPVIFIKECWRIAENVGGADIGAIFVQLKGQKLGLPYVPAAVCAAIVAAIKLLIRKHRAIASVFAVVIIIAGVAASLLYLKVNNIPVITMVRIALDFLRRGAF